VKTQEIAYRHLLHRYLQNNISPKLAITLPSDGQTSLDATCPQSEQAVQKYHHATLRAQMSRRTQ
jgi:hypothetical protein